jgi:transposase
MDVARIREGIRKMRFSTIWDRWESGEIGRDAAAELLGMSVRTFQRWSDRYEAEGEVGLVDRRGGPSLRRSPQEEVERMLGLYRDKYSDFTVKHFHEQLTKRHNYTLGYTATKSHLHRAGLVRPAPKRSAHRKKRPRRPMRGKPPHAV